jgi:hypothetical protein
MYRVYYLNRKVATYRDRDSALNYIIAEVGKGKEFGDYEILDGSDSL